MRIANSHPRKQTSFDALLADRDVIPSLNELDRLVADAKRRRERAAALQQQQGAGGGQIDPPTP